MVNFPDDIWNHIVSFMFTIEKPKLDDIYNEDREIVLPDCSTSDITKLIKYTPSENDLYYSDCKLYESSVVVREGYRKIYKGGDISHIVDLSYFHNHLPGGWDNKYFTYKSYNTQTVFTMFSISSLDFKRLYFACGGNDFDELTPDMFVPLCHLFDLPEKYGDYYVIPSYASKMGLLLLLWNELKLHIECDKSCSTNKFKIKMKFSVYKIKNAIGGYSYPYLRISKYNNYRVPIAFVIKNGDSCVSVNIGRNKYLVLKRTEQLQDWSIYSLANIQNLENELENCVFLRYFFIRYKKFFTISFNYIMFQSGLSEIT